MIMNMADTSGATDFSISYNFFDESHETEISIWVNGQNILSFERNGKIMTTRWNLDEIAFWLRKFVDNMSQDPYPVGVSGEYAAIKDINAREFDTEDDDEFDAYYDRLYEWNLRHRWHPASAGAILADVYFQLIGDSIEVSWNNTDAEEEVTFRNLLGGARVGRKLFVSAVDSFIQAYTRHWENVCTNKDFSGQSQTTCSNF